LPLSIGDRITIIGRGNREVPAEIVGFRGDRALAMPFGVLDGVGLGARAVVTNTRPVVYPHESWLGRVINALGEEIDRAGAALCRSRRA